MPNIILDGTPAVFFLRHAHWYKPFSHTSQQLVEFEDVMTSFNTAAVHLRSKPYLDVPAPRLASFNAPKNSFSGRVLITSDFFAQPRLAAAMP